MNKRKLFLTTLTVLFTLGVLTGCAGNNTADTNTSIVTDEKVLTNSESNEEIVVEENKEPYQTISPVTAKEMMDSDNTLIILDVRTLDEYNSGHIENAVLLPNTSIADDAESVLPDKDQTILVYCRSGNRSASASAELASMGYTNVYDFGGIIDWIYDVVVE